jgi:hypothetical protein
MNATDDKTKDTITIIVEESATLAGGGSSDKGGGQTHSLSTFFKKAVPKEIDGDVLRQNVNRFLDKFQATLGDVKQRSIDGWDLEDMKVSLAVTAEGSVGVATLGMEAGIELTFKRTK